MVAEADRAGGRRIDAADVVDVFVYVVVLNLAIEYLPGVLSESFTLSVVTAVLLKIVLEVVVWAKNRVKRRFRAARTAVGKLAAALMLWLVLIGSKFVVLELVALLFRGSVKLGNFFAVTGLIIVLMLCRAAVRRLLALPDATSPDPADAGPTNTSSVG